LLFSTPGRSITWSFELDINQNESGLPRESLEATTAKFELELNFTYPKVSIMFEETEEQTLLPKLQERKRLEELTVAQLQN
jgi:hypothetical protein